jgi:tRNA wybutosine-synthesizing protein 3
MKTENNIVFKNGKQHASTLLQTAIDTRKVDTEILPILHQINQLPCYYTSSSCAGRIVLLQIPGLGDKKNAVFLGKWHRQVSIEEVNEAMKTSSSGLIWILSQSPIIHVIAKSLTDADKLVKVAISSGLKNSGFKTFDKKIVVELCSTERLDAPIGEKNTVYCTEEHLILLIKIANSIILKSQEKMKRFRKNLEKMVHVL